MTTTRLSLSEVTISELQDAYRRGEATCREVTEWYLHRIDVLDRSGPTLNSVITVSPDALADADALDAALPAGGPVGPLHGVPVLVKDQVDTVGMPTTLGSQMFAEYLPDQDATVIRRLKEAGALVLAKTTLGELGGGDTHGTLFGSTRNPYDLEAHPGRLVRGRPQRLRPTSVRSRSGRRGSPRSAGRRRGTAPWGCGRPSAWSVGSVPTAAGPARTARSDR